MKKKKNEDRSDRLKKYFGYGLAVGLGISAFASSPESIMKSSRYLSRIKKTTKSIDKSINIIGVKNLNYKNIKNIYSKNIKNKNSVWNLTKKEAEKIKLRYDSNKSMLSTAFLLKNLNPKIVGMKRAESEFAYNVAGHILSKFGDTKTTTYFEAQKLVQHVLSNRKDFFEVSLERNGLKYTPLVNKFDKVTKNISLNKNAKSLAFDMAELLSKEDDFIEKSLKEFENNNLFNKQKKVFLQNMIEKFHIKNFKNKENLVTVQDLIENIEKNKIDIVNRNIKKSPKDNDYLDILDILKENIKQNKDFANTVVDYKALRKTDNGEIYSIVDTIKTMNYFQDKFADTIPGHLFWRRSSLEMKKAPNYLFMGMGDFDPKLENAIGAIGSDIRNSVLTDNVYKLGDKFYKEIKDNITGAIDFKYIEGSDKFKLTSAEYGPHYNILKKMYAIAPEVEQKSSFLNFFDIGKTRNKFNEFYSKFTKFDNDDWSKNVFDRFTNNKYNEYFLKNFGENLSEESKNALLSNNIDKIKKQLPEEDFLKYKLESIRKVYDDLNFINRKFEDFANLPDYNSLEKMKNITTGRSNKILSSLIESDNIIEDALNFVSAEKNSEVYNDNLISLLKKYTNDIQNIESVVHIGKTSEKNKNVLNYEDMVRRELFKESILEQMSKYSTGSNNITLEGYSQFLQNIEGLNISNNEFEKAKLISDWAFFQNIGDLYHRKNYMGANLQHKNYVYENISEIIFNPKEEFKDSSEILKSHMSTFSNEIVGSFNGKLDSDFSELDPLAKGQNKNWFVVEKGINPLDIIKETNDDIIIKAFKQLKAGRNDLDNLTTTSFYPYHFLNRLSSAWDTIGLGFSNENTGDVGSLAKSIALKRLLPAAGIMYGLSYLNYESENLTGTSFQEAWYDGKASFDLGLEKTKDLFNLNDKGKISRQYNDIARYWFGEESLNYDEKLDYYENGYDPIRKGRFWNFGSSSEFRGGEIIYFSPNRLRQAHSNYRDVSIYGSSEEKWKHSILPTPRHPLSTLRYLSNPYWLEEKNYEDRPYPVSGTMFDENSVWGVVLNPTVGRIIKPQKQMHKEHLQGTLIDVRSIIEEKNNEIIEKARERSLIEINENGYTPIEMNPDSSPTGHEEILDIGINNGNVGSIGGKGEDVGYNYSDLKDVEYSSSYANQINNTTNKRNTNNNDFFYHNKLNNTIFLMNEGINPFSKNISKDIIRNINSNIIEKAYSNEKDATKSIDKNLIKNPMKKHEEELENNFNNVENISKQDYVNNLLYSANQISGMYGFMYGEIFPKTKAAKLEQAGNMNSFSRHFWDDNIGGIGSSFMEIARRFFPHANHDIAQINPIRNTMPEWMPGRFKIGDPYTKILKGEARLPGPGFETLNKLHSDEFGRYGSFDRYKILSDIAPYSDEYKLWKSIAKKEVQDAELKKEMEQIEKRVQKQIKKHDFFDYKFIGQQMSSENATISEVSDDGKFKIIGSNEQFKVAGIKPLSDENGSYIHKYLKEGMNVSLMYDKNSYQQKDKNGNKVAVVSNNGMNISREMFLNNEAEEKKNKDTLTDQYYGFTDSNIMLGHILEGIGHMPLSFVHNKYLRIDSALESYKKEYIYGSPFSSWSHPIKTFLEPSFRNSWSNSPTWQMIGLGSWALSEYTNYKSSSKMMKFATNSLFGLTNPAAFAGGMIASLPTMKTNKLTRVGARIGATVGLVGYGIASADNPLLSMANFGAAGALISKQLKHPKYSTSKGALIGAGIGLAVSGFRNPDGLWITGSNTYIPKKTKNRWDIEEYYDRLAYMKYSNLYKKAARKAKDEEDVDVKSIISKFEKYKKKNKREIDKLQKLKNKIELEPNDNDKKNLLKEIDDRIYALSTPSDVFYGGKYTRAAIAYKKALDSTITGLNRFSDKTDILRSLPQYDRDFFLNFAKEKDLKKRKKILKFLSPYEKKAMFLMWDKEDENFKNENPTKKDKKVKKETEKFFEHHFNKLEKKIDTNREYFKSHKLPGLTWFGWQPQIDLENIKIKTIQNEGMLLSDFGIYESALNTEAYKEAPEIENYRTDTSSIAVTKNIAGLLHGRGFSDIDVVVNPSNEKGLKIISNFVRISKYNMSNAISNLF